MTEMIVRVIGKREDPDNKIHTHYMLSDGKIYTREEVIEMWRKRLLPGYHLHERNGVKLLRDNPHTKEDDLIDNQPLI